MNHELGEILAQLDGVLVGKRAQLQLAACCLVAGGHLLIEDLPGVGKTTLAHALARSFGLEFTRVQFTSDLLPADLLGYSLPRRDAEGLVFQPGPVFTQVLLADEINRAPPKTQSALLEAMEERQVSVEGRSHALPEPFFVIATQNPHDQRGTYPLPESQLDRFLMSLSLGYPDAAAERALLLGEDRRELLRRLPPRLDRARLLRLQQQAQQVHVSAALADYVQRLLDATRQGQDFACGLSPRAGLLLLRAARAHALLHARDYCAPQDVQAVLPAVAVHRLGAPGEQQAGGPMVAARLQQLLQRLAL